MIFTNNNSSSKLPSIFINELGGRFLLDTGASQSLISPDVINNLKLNKYIKKEPHCIKTAHGFTRHNDVIYLQLPQRFNSKELQKFLIFEFDKDFKGLLGIDFFRSFGCKLDIKNLLLTSEYFEIPITTDIKSHCILKPRHEQCVKLLCNYMDGDYILDEYSNDLFKIPAAVIKIKDGYFYTSIINTSEKFIRFQRNTHFKLIPYNEEKDNIEKINFMQDSNTNYLLKNNLKRLRTEHMNSEEKREIEKLCYKYRDIFYCENIPLTFTHEIKHKLRLKDTNPSYVKNYRQAPKQREEINNQIQALLKQNIIRESNSPWSCPVHIVPKKPDASGQVKWRLVIDYRRLNDKTIEDKYPLPNINDILDKLGRAQYFTTLDLASGYHQVEMHKDDIEKTAFSTERGHYEFLRMPFGLKNAPSTFQRLMDSVLRGIKEPRR